MAFEAGPSQIIGTQLATADLSALQYTFVQLTTLGGISGTTINTQIPFGILQNAPTAGQAAEVLVSGVSKLTAGTSAIVAGDRVGSTAGGKAVTLTTGSSAWVAATVISGTLSTTFNGLITVNAFCAQRVL